MRAGYAAVTVVAVIAYAYAAALNFTHDKSVVQTAERLSVPVTWQGPLGVLLAAGSAGLLVGFAVPALGTAAGWPRPLLRLRRGLPHPSARHPGVLVGHVVRVLRAGVRRAGGRPRLPRPGLTCGFLRPGRGR